MNKQDVDLYWTQEGDFALDTSKEDLRSTKDDHYRCLVQQILGRVMSNKGDWDLQKSTGCNVSDFLGQANTRITGQKLQERLVSELTRDALVSPSSLRVDVVPTGKSSIEIFIQVAPPGSRQAIRLSFGYDLSENRLVARIG